MGFSTRSGDDIERFARTHGYVVRRINFDMPDDVSPLAANFYRLFNRHRGVIGNRLLVESFVLMEPY